MCSVRSEDMILKELRTKLKLKSMRKCLQDKGPQWFGHLERMEERSWSTIFPIIIWQFTLFLCNFDRSQVK